MKNRWIGSALVVAAMTLAACAPTQSGGGSSDSAEPAQVAGETPSGEPAENTDPDY